MNSFDSMIERYKKELVDAKRRSIEREILSPSFDESEPATAEIEEEAVSVSAAYNETNEEKETPELKEPQTEPESSEKETERTEAERFGVFPVAESSDEEKSNLDETFIPDDENVVFEENEPYQESLGSLKVQVFMANRAYPVSSSHVVITGADNKKVYFDGYTNTNGVVGSILLPAPKKSFSQSPQEKPPYSKYDITVSHPYFQKRKYLGVPVFSGVESIQNIQLLPLGTDERDNTDVTESEPNELLMKGGESNA
ncbi:MAG: hypothetical protein Q4D20_01400 [Clostridia bacterium]|nr:hypothetical protein [Clostridia bacterium]